MPYRQLSEGPISVDIEREHAALLALAARATRLRRIVLLPGIVIGVVAGLLGYLLVREFQFTLSGGVVQFPWVSAVVGGLPLAGGSMRGAKHVADVLVERRRPSWIAEMAACYGIPPESLTEFDGVL